MIMMVNIIMNLTIMIMIMMVNIYGLMIMITIMMISGEFYDIHQ